VNAQSGPALQARSKAFRFMRALETGCRCVPQTVVSRRKDDFKFSEAVGWFIVGFGHDGYWLIEFIELIGLIELFVRGSYILVSFESAMYSNPRSAFRNPKSVGWLLATGYSMLANEFLVLDTGCSKHKAESS
jgi:hypothetical protein